jgi:hypothetical protein
VTIASTDSPNHRRTKHIIETFEEEGRAVSTQESAAREEWEMEHVARLPNPWTDSRPHPRIVNQLAGGNKYFVIL